MEKNCFDVVVVGGGAAGLTAACTAAALGRSVLLLEHAPLIGGTTAISGGMVWIPDNDKMREAGIHDSREAARNYLTHTVPGAQNDPRIWAFLEHSNEAIRFLEAHTSLKLQAVKRYPDYYPELSGATEGGRVLEPMPYDGRELGADFRLLRDPLPEFMLFGGMMISREDIPQFRRFTRSPRAASNVAKLLLRYAAQRVRAHRGTTLVLGNALAARLLKSARELKVDIRLQASVTQLICNGDRVTGVEAEVREGKRTFIARSGVILATGGISHDAKARAAYVPEQAGNRSATVASGARQGGARLAEAVGAAMSPRSTGLENALAFWVPVSTFHRADGSEAVFPHTVTDRAKPGLIAVGSDGRRFVNEAVSYHEFVRAQLKHANRAATAWLVCDRRFLWKYGLGKIKPFALTVRREIAEGYVKWARTLEGLAQAIGVPPDAFVQTIQAFNEHAHDGRDPAFGRGANIYQRHLGDVDQQPNPCVVPIERGPFYAVSVVPGDLGMAAGLQTDANAKVLRSDGTAIDGLYACGNDMHSIMNGAYPGPGITLGPALVFGYLAASHAVGSGDAS
ncbi:FAD-dependent oxidoreductase [Burkholderia ambifaria]|uniref:FAD-dependent oxidoreductase n=1 Tax=Burkholderia ambifaria TaxID=152480 RepID=UPI001B9403B4|nr:FAD-dependent oxidoreductase [Burkholderia ambifaria]